MKKLTSLDFRLFIGCTCRIFDPSGYKPIANDPDNIEPIIGTIDGINIAYDRVLWNHKEYDPDVVKLILRKFDSLSRVEVEELNKLWPKEKINRDTFSSIVLDAEIINYLTLLRVDVFNWIDQGLAIDAAYITNN